MFTIVVIKRNNITHECFIVKRRRNIGKEISILELIALHDNDGF